MNNSNSDGKNAPQAQHHPISHRSAPPGHHHHANTNHAPRAANDSTAMNKKGIVTAGRDRSQMVIFSSAANEKGFTSHSEVMEAHRQLDRVHFSHSLSNDVLQFRRQGAKDERNFEELKAKLEAKSSTAPRRQAGWTSLKLDEHQLANSEGRATGVRSSPVASPKERQRNSRGERSPRQEPILHSAAAVEPVEVPKPRKRSRSGALSSISQAYGPP